MSAAKFPATQLVHTPSGATACCDVHAAGLHWLMRFLGTHAVSTVAPDDATCANCENEAISHDRKESSR